MPEVDDIPDLDLFLNVEVLLTHNRKYIKLAKVIVRITYCYVKPVGTPLRNTIVNTNIYDVMFPGGAI